IMVPYLAQGNELSDIEDAAEFGRDDNRGGHSYEYNAIYDGARKDSSGRPISSYSERHKRNKDFMFKPQEMMLVHDNDDKFDNQQQPAMGCDGMRSLFSNGNNC